MLKEFFTDKKGKFAVAQPPNIPLILWAVFSLIAYFSEDNIKNVFSFLAHASLLAWAYFELTSGSSPFRRALGLVVMIIVFLNIFK
jgi:hypothetical protein